jgi:transposase InsO family protein
MERIVSLHGVSKKIVSNRGTQFTSQFWYKLHQSLGTKLNFSSAYHPQTDGQTERINQILEDMLRACALQYGTSWDKSLPYVSSHTTIVTQKVSRWHLSRLCMDVSAEPHCFGTK